MKKSAQTSEVHALVAKKRLRKARDLARKQARKGKQWLREQAELS